LRLEVLRLHRIAQRRLVVALVAAGVGSGLLPLLFTASIGLLVGLIPDVVGDGFSSHAGHLLVWSLAGMATVMIAQQVVEPVQGALQAVTLHQIDESIRAKTIDDLSRPRGIGHLEDPTLMDHLFRIRELDW